MDALETSNPSSPEGQKREESESLRISVVLFVSFCCDVLVICFSDVFCIACVATMASVSVRYI